ncbi:MAG TPA: hypothetical protein VNT26_03595, partial [Candidatus Sulfotelmatobacter sp.]|nr:hypothetical protein [Candidatus Sulfotelmatobacter sp.]
MRIRFEPIFRGSMVFLVLTLAWGMWASAQPATNPPAATATNPVAPLVQHVERLQGEPLTFGLDRIPWLGEVRFLGEPLWKYVASLIYILLAFYVSKLIDLVTQVWLKGLASKTETKLDDLL